LYGAVTHGLAKTTKKRLSKRVSDDVGANLQAVDYLMERKKALIVPKLYAGISGDWTQAMS